MCFSLDEEDEQSKISLDSTIYDFSVDHGSIEKEDMLNNYKYLMIKNSVN